MTATTKPETASRAGAAGRLPWRGELVAHRTAIAGFAAAAPLAIISPKALWIAAVVVAIARLIGMIGGAGAPTRAALRDLARLRTLWLVGALALASALWAIDPMHSLTRGLRLALELGVGGLVVGLAVAADAARAVGYLRAAGLGLIGAALLGTLDIQFDGTLFFWAHGNPAAIYAYGRGAAFAALVLVPLVMLLWLRSQRFHAALTLAAGLVFILTAANETAKLAMIAGAVGGALALWRWTRPLPVLMFAVALVAIPLVVPLPLDGPVGCWLMEQKLSIIHRLGVWNYADTLIAERPLLGWGLEASRAAPGGTTLLAIPDCGAGLNPTAFGPVLGERMPLHPHGFTLNLWLELGGLGAALGLCVLTDWALRLTRLPASRAIAFGAMAGGVFLPATVSFGMWQGWWLATLFLLAALCCMAPGARPPIGAGRATRP